jgi:ABC-type branched-subunit amino acid transport system permease subunit
MRDYLPYIIIGVISGSVYGIAALGLVLTYKTSGIFNVGHGAIAAASAIVFYFLHVQHGMPWPPAALISVGLFGIVAGLLLERLAAGLAPTTVAYRIIATVALILIVTALYTLKFGAVARTFPTFLPDGVAFRISGVRVGWDGVITIVLGLASVLGLFVFFRISRLGVSMRAVVDRPELLDLTGDSPAQIRRVAWVIGSSFAAVSGLLLVNTQQQLDVILLSLLVVAAFGAATFGAFRSLPLAYAGGVTLGVVQGVAGKLTADHPTLAGLDTNMPFLFLFIGLLVIPRAKLVELGQRATRQVRTRRKATRTTRAINSSVVLIVLLGALLVPALVGTKLPTWTNAAAELPLFLSLGLLVRTSGQISLCQIGFAAIGATTFGHMLNNGLPWGLAVLVAGAVAIPVGAIVAIPAIRLSGLYLALATLGFGILLAQFFYTKKYMFGPTVSLDTHRPTVLNLDSDKGYYYLLLAIGLAAALLVVLIERSRLGRLLRGMSDSPTALTMLGTNTNVSRVLVFCVSAFLAAISGALIAGVFGSINREPFNYFYSLVVLAVLMICGRRTVPAAFLATVALNVPPAYFSGDKVISYQQLIFGSAVIFVAVTSGGRLTSAIAAFAARFEHRRVGPAGARIDPNLRPRSVDRSESAVSV